MLIGLVALQIGILFACGAYLVMRRGEIKLILGLSLMSHAVNLLLFSTGAWQRGLPPILDKSNIPTDFSAYVDPIPQALILTAIVISFGVLAFVVVLVKRRFEVTPIVSTTASELSAQAPGTQAPDYYEFGMDPTDDDYEWLESLPDREETTYPERNGRKSGVNTSAKANRKSR
jgi:multicomponent Na+:H+ antiporter subunit C